MQEQAATASSGRLNIATNIRLVLTAFLVGALWITGCDQQRSADDAGAPKIGKGDELRAAREDGPTASQVFGNANKWAGHYVRLDCKITNVIADSDEANAMCGKGIAADPEALAKTPNIDYSDPDAVSRAEAEQEKAGQQFARDVQDQALMVLVGDHVSEFDGNQRVTIIGPVLGSEEGKNGMGATMDYATVRVDYAE
jgi:hypothetical protein